MSFLRFNWGCRFYTTAYLKIFPNSTLFLINPCPVIFVFLEEPNIGWDWRVYLVVKKFLIWCWCFLFNVSIKILVRCWCFPRDVNIKICSKNKILMFTLTRKHQLAPDKKYFSPSDTFPSQPKLGSSRKEIIGIN